MLTIDLIAVGKVKSPWIIDGVAHYAKLLSKFATLNIVEVRDAAVKSISVQEALASEAEYIRKHLADRAIPILLDAAGKRRDSEQLADDLRKLQLSTSRIQFIIGGPFGIDRALKKTIKESLSLSALTLPHELCRIVLLEQLYRAFSILHGSKYHK